MWNANAYRVRISQVHPGVEPTILKWFGFFFLSGVWSMPILKTVLAIAVLPAVAAGYVTVMGTTGACSTCASIVSMVTCSSCSDPGTTGDTTTTAMTAVTDKASDSPIVAQGMFTVPLIDLQGNQTTLAAYAGRPMLVEVWATWCGPCRKVRSILKENEAELSKIATVVGVSVDQGGAAMVTRYLEKSPSPGILEFMVTPEFRAAIAPIDTQSTIPKLLYVRPDGQVSNLSYGANSPKFMMAMLKNLAKTSPSSNPNPAG
jgi:thiol-disulfide isomerase/thioredoxin